MDDSGWIEYWNEGAHRLTGYPEAEVLGKHCIGLGGLRAGRIWCQADCSVRRSVRQGRDSSHVCLDVQASDGRRVPVAVTFVVLTEQDGQVIVHLLQDASRQDELRQTLHGVLSFSRVSERSVREGWLRASRRRRGRRSVTPRSTSRS